jgi:hypothetical protein
VLLRIIKLAFLDASKILALLTGPNLPKIFVQSDLLDSYVQRGTSLAIIIALLSAHETGGHYFLTSNDTLVGLEIGQLRSSMTPPDQPPSTSSEMANDQ